MRGRNLAAFEWLRMIARGRNARHMILKIES
jgi:hypothetical protein